MTRNLNGELRMRYDEHGKTCDMVIIETETLDVVWECSVCKTKFKATNKFERSKTCPACDSTIVNWVGVDDYDE